MNLKIAIIQMQVGLDIQDNTARICQAIEQAGQASAQILLTPEGALSGYTPDFDPARVSAGLQTVTELAHRLKVGLALGTCFREADGRTYNQLRFYSPGGRFLGFHSKILRCGSMTEPSVGEINHYATTPLRVFTFQGVTIGGLICNDLWANPACTPMPDPHLSQQLAAMGAQIIFHAVNGGRDGSDWSKDVTFHYHDFNLRMRAEAGKVWIVTVDNCAPLSFPCSAPGGVISPQGNWVSRTPSQGEAFLVQVIT